MDLDWHILNSIQALRSPVGDAVFPGISFLGAMGWIWIALGIVLVIVPKTRRAGIVLLVAIAIDLILVNMAMKPLIARERPYVLDPDFQLIVPPENDYSFPSGHTAISFAAASALFFARSRLWIPASVVAALIAFSRLYLYVHFPSDVLAGCLIGILCGFLAWLIVGRFRRKPDAKT